jgi:hypothetical protein
MAQTSEERVRRHRLREAGYALKPCPEGTLLTEVVAWAEGVWKRQGELMDARRRSALA